MTTSRTLYSRNAFAAAALTLLGTVAAMPAQAQTSSRAPVRAGTEQAQAGNRVESVFGENYGPVAPQATSARTRAEVRDATTLAHEAGTLVAPLGEGDGTRPVALRAAHPLL